ncbi:MAG: aspartate 1-decarboxylase [Chitinivibrionales bacterium]|nr:aspartate 1-decarboxylase [Chitinivibrionales bacterium]
MYRLKRAQTKTPHVFHSSIPAEQTEYHCYGIYHYDSERVRMLRKFLNAKLRDIAITGTYLEYEGSIALDEDYIEQCGFIENEAVDVLNMSNGVRFQTYVIKAERGSKKVELNGPAARLGAPGDKVMVLSYALLTPDEIPRHTPTVVRVKPSSVETN